MRNVSDMIILQNILNQFIQYITLTGIEKEIVLYRGVSKYKKFGKKIILENNVAILCCLPKHV